MENEDYSAKARNLITARLDRATQLIEGDLFTMNLNLPADYKYRSIREVQTIMVKGAFDALAFAVELGLFTKQDATAFWQELHQQFGKLWPEGSVS